MQTVIKSILLPSLLLAVLPGQALAQKKSSFRTRVSTYLAPARYGRVNGNPTYTEYAIRDGRRVVKTRIRQFSNMQQEEHKGVIQVGEKSHEWAATVRRFPDGKVEQHITAYGFSRQEREELLKRGWSNAKFIGDDGWGNLNMTITTYGNPYRPLTTLRGIGKVLDKNPIAHTLAIGAAATALTVVAGALGTVPGGMAANVIPGLVIGTPVGLLAGAQVAEKATKPHTGRAVLPYQTGVEHMLGDITGTMLK